DARSRPLPSRPPRDRPGATRRSGHGLRAQVERLQAGRDDPPQAHLRRRGPLAPARLDRAAARHEELRARVRRPRRARGHLGALGAVRRAVERVEPPRGRAARTGAGRRQPTGNERLPPDGVRRTMSPARRAAPLLLQALRARRRPRASSRRDQGGPHEGRRGAHARPGRADGPLRAAVAAGRRGLPAHRPQRNTPTVLNAMFNATQFWDGRAPSLEEQAKLPILNPIEMGQKSPDDVVAKVRALPEYREAFSRVFGHEATYDDIAAAIAAFERTQYAGDAPFDRFVA